MPKNLDHVRLGPGGRVFCQHCGDEYQVAMPVDLDVMISITKTYGKKHANCKKRDVVPPPTR